MTHIEMSDAARTHIAKRYDRLAELIDQQHLLILSWVRVATLKRPDGSVEKLGPDFFFGLQRRNNLKGFLLYKLDHDREVGFHPQSEFMSGTAFIDYADGKLSLKVS